MLLELPRLTNSLREPFDADQAYLNRKSILRSYDNNRSSSKSFEDSEVARKIVYRWDEASVEVRQAYKQFVGAVVELINGVVISEEFKEVALAAYRLFGARTEGEEDRRIIEKKSELQKILGHVVSDANIRKVVDAAQNLSNLQPNNHDEMSFAEIKINGSDHVQEFGADLVFHPPARFVVDSSFEDGEMWGEERNVYSTSLHGEWRDHSDTTNLHPVISENFDLGWLRDECNKVVNASTSQLPQDELAMAICRVLDSKKAGDEIAGDLLDLVGDSAFELVQDLIMHRKELVDAIHHGMLNLKSEKVVSSSQPRMPSYGTQVTVQTESERQIDKLRRKEEKKQRRGTDQGVDNELSVMSFSSLLQASVKKSPFDDLIGHGDGTNTLAATALPQGTVRKHHKGYEEVSIPPTQTAPMKPGEKLIDITELDEFAQAAFQGYKTLNRIQSRIFQTTYNTNENILVCAPTGAGKTNIAMIAVLHEIGQHFKDGYLHKDEFKIVYVAPMKALAAEVTKAFSHRLAPLNMVVKELTGDMQLSRNELEVG